MRITRCPRCRAEDISADAHPARVLPSGAAVPLLVCRNCYRPAELEYRIACETSGIPYSPIARREGLRLLRDFYLDRFAEQLDPDLLVEDSERDAGLRPIRAALEEVERRLAEVPVEEEVTDG